jgi:putative phosphoesterase
MTLLGVISDTHGLLRREAIDALAGSELIIHAGDVGKSEIIERLREIAPVVAVRGNVDTAPWAEALPGTQVVRVAGRSIIVLHDRSQLVADPVTAGYAAVVFGHSHHALVETRGGVLYLNPGSSGPRRFRFPITVARLRVSIELLEPEIVQLI